MADLILFLVASSILLTIILLALILILVFQPLDPEQRKRKIGHDISKIKRQIEEEE